MTLHVREPYYLFIPRWWRDIERVKTAAGDEIVLRQRGDVFDIRFNGWELMSNQATTSEKVLAEIVCDQIAAKAPKLLIGGLWMGFTLRAAQDALGPSAQIVVCELIPEIVTWNKGPLAVLAAHPLRDTRVRVWSNSVVDVIAKGDLMFDALLMDTDNGPDCVVHGPNRILYQPQELKQKSRVLMSNGLAGFWSAARSPDFEAVMDSES